MNKFWKDTTSRLKEKQSIWCVTGVAGFIGSHLLEFLLKNNQRVIGIDNFVTGSQKNIDEVRSLVHEKTWSKFQFIEADVSAYDTILNALDGVDYVLHQAALGSVPRSIEDPIATNRANIDGFLSVLRAASVQKVKGFVYASSSSVYGSSPQLPKIEGEIGDPLSPYAVTKRVNELYAAVFSDLFSIKTVGLRYFNVFGPRQNPTGPYAAVIPIWVESLMNGKSCVVNGDGTTSRDFCFVRNVVQANILAALAENISSTVVNIAVGERTTLSELYSEIAGAVADVSDGSVPDKPDYRDFRVGDVKHSHADISHARDILCYEPQVRVGEGIKETVNWFASQRATSTRNEPGLGT